jgi:pimeloyl-ACP methyl ester carboxylesterase
MGRWIKRAAVVLLVGLAVFVFGVAPFWLAGMATTRRFQFPDKENAGLTPASFQLAFGDVAFHSADGVPLQGWWVPAPEARGTVVLVHGLNRSRIEMVKKVPFLHRAGWNSLLFDLRHHGQSGGEASTFGDRERLDVHAAKTFATARARGPVVLWGVSLGAAAATLAAAEDPSVAGLVCDSTYRSLRDTVRHHLGLFRRFRWWLRLVPSWPVASEVVWWMGRRADFDPDSVDLVAAASRLGGRPALFVCNSGDRRMPPEIAFELKAVAGENARLLVVPGNTHGGAWREGTAAYEKAVGDLLAEAAAGTRLASAR